MYVVCVYACMYACKHVSMYACLYMYVGTRIYASKPDGPTTKHSPPSPRPTACRLRSGPGCRWLLRHWLTLGWPATLASARLATSGWLAGWLGRPSCQPRCPQSRASEVQCSCRAWRCRRPSASLGTRSFCRWCPGVLSS